MQRSVGYATVVLLATALFGFPSKAGQKDESSLEVLTPIVEGNLAVFPVVTNNSPDTSRFLTLDEGIRLNQVVVAEAGSNGLVRPRPGSAGPIQVWSEHPVPLSPLRLRDAASVNELVLENHSDRPLILLAGEIVTGGKQDRVVAKDRIVPAHSEPIALGVFCVEPHRWTQTTANFGSFRSSFAQPSVRREAMADRNQEQVWAEVNRFRSSMAGAAPPTQFAFSSSYAGAVQNKAVQSLLDRTAAPIEHAYSEMLGQLRSKHAVGAVVAVNGEVIWADVFPSSALLEAYWPKLVRSYAAEALTPSYRHTRSDNWPTLDGAKAFLKQLESNHEEVETDPGVYRSTEYQGNGFDAFFLTSLLPNTGYVVHIAKMKAN